MDKKKNNVKGTLKQRRAIVKIVENGGNVSAAMREAGYSPATAENPSKLTESDGFKKLAEEYLPDDLLLKVHKEGLQAKTYVNKIVGRDDKGRPEYELVSKPDFNARHKYVDLGYKVREKIKQATGYPGIALQLNIDQVRKDYD